MTISEDRMIHTRSALAASLLSTQTSLDMRTGPQHSSAEALKRVNATARRMMPRLLVDAPEADVLTNTVLSVLTELVDVTTRHQASVDLAGRIAYDGSHVLLTVGEMNRPLPESEEEPGLFLVHRLVDDVGQYRGDEDGYVTWVSVPVRPKTQ
ncbi:hypothetical protein [Streptomyces scopuliridis]|uniref:hypothetical protein n=1 Tax=Streptomyces scopuliridis TaxID=452529 RepID=UPI0036987B44